MSYRATHWAYDLPLIGPAKFVLVALADMADEANTCYPGQKRLAIMTGFSEKTVSRAINSLDTMGLLTREQRHGNFGYRTSDRYRLNIDVGMPETLTDREPTRQRAFKALSPSLTDSQSIPNGLSGGAVETPDESPVEPPDKEIALLPSIGFLDFWQAWPKSNGKKAAEAAWVKAIKRASPEAIVQAAIDYATAPHRPAIQFVPYGATWLNGDLWEDDLPQAPEAERKPTRSDENLAYVQSLYASEQLGIQA